MANTEDYDYLGGFDDEDPDDREEDNMVTGRNCFIFLIYAGKDMYETQADSESYLSQALECSREAVLSLCRKQKWDLTATVLFGTEKREGDMTPENVVLLQPLRLPSVSGIRAFDNFKKDNCAEVNQKYGWTDQFNLSSALHYCQRLIVNSQVKIYNKTVIVITCDDNPCPDPISGHKARKQVQEYFLLHIDIEVIGLGDFDSNKFYKELIVTARDELLVDWKDRDPVLKVDDLMEQIDKLTEKFIRRLSYLHLHEDYKLYVALYKLYSEPKKFVTQSQSHFDSSPAYVEPKPGSELPMPSGSAESPSRTKEALVEVGDKQPFIGGRLINITRKELKSYLNTKVRGFEIIGFMKTSDIPMYYSLGECYIVLPSPGDQNNKIVFSHLVHRCLARQMSIVCWYTPHKSAPCAHCVLHPVEETEYAEGRVHSPGFIMCKLPYQDLLMELDEVETTVEPSKQQMEAAAMIIKKTTFPYTVDRFSDIELRRRVAMIEAIALEYEDVPDLECDTDIDLENLSERLGSLNASFLDCSHIPEDPISNKRGGGACDSDTQQKRVKTELSSSDIADMIRSGSANKLTVANLRMLLKQEGVRNTNHMKKPELITVAEKLFNN